jgi:hypothetical protein
VSHVAPSSGHPCRTPRAHRGPSGHPRCPAAGRLCPWESPTGPGRSDAAATAAGRVTGDAPDVDAGLGPPDRPTRPADHAPPSIPCVPCSHRWRVQRHTVATHRSDTSLTPRRHRSGMTQGQTAAALRRRPVTPAEPPVLGYDPTRFVLGRPCPRGHLFGETGQTRRRVRRGDCPQCTALQKRAAKQRRGDA